MKFYTTVFLAPASQESVIPALTAALAPFDANDYRHEPFDPDAAWDWWRLPERAVLPLRPEHLDDSQAIRVAHPGMDPVVVAAPKGTVDFDAIRRAAREQAAGAWDAWTEVADAHPGALPRVHFDELHDDPDEAQRAYLLQPAIQEVAQAAATQEHPYFSFSLLLADPVMQFSGEREVFLAQAAAESVATHAYVTIDGRWLSQYTNDRGWDAHVLAMAEYLDSLPDGAVIARVWCHI
ncbi:hypothetical protein [Micromonospora sp. NPDC047074]|uniref:hypothetical protein n=1 Tax=Micromonospora sp. NPDC047074 TaxID=3154339 RepID=UPI00340E7674